HHGERVAAKALMGEDVEDMIGKAHRGHSFGSRAGGAHCAIPHRLPSSVQARTAGPTSPRAQIFFHLFQRVHIPATAPLIPHVGHALAPIGSVDDARWASWP